MGVIIGPERRKNEERQRRMVRLAYVLSMYAKLPGMEVRMSLARFD